MTREREVRKIGNSWFVKLNPIDIEDFKLEIGDKLDLEDCLIINHGRKKKHGKREEKKK